jgi:hypothetical protein
MIGTMHACTCCARNDAMGTTNEKAGHFRGHVTCRYLMFAHPCTQTPLSIRESIRFLQSRKRLCPLPSSTSSSSPNVALLTTSSPFVSSIYPNRIRVSLTLSGTSYGVSLPFAAISRSRALPVVVTSVCMKLVSIAGAPFSRRARKPRKRKGRDRRSEAAYGMMRRGREEKEKVV